MAAARNTFPVSCSASGVVTGAAGAPPRVRLDPLLVLASTLATAPRLVEVDEPCSGLSPTAVSKVIERLVTLRDKGQVTIVMVEHNVRRILAIADLVVVLDVVECRSSGHRLRSKTVSASARSTHKGWRLRLYCRLP